MPIFKDHHGQFYKVNTALVALTSLCVIGSAVAFSSPYWASSYPVLAPLVAFAATPLGMGILATVAVALIGLAVYAISKNNEISELKAPKFVVISGKVKVQVAEAVLKEIKENSKNRGKDGEVMEGEYRVDFTNSEGKECYVIVKSDKSQGMGDAEFLSIKSQAMKNSSGKYDSIDESSLLKTLGLGTGEKDAKVFNTYLERVVVQAAQSQEQNK